MDVYEESKQIEKKLLEIPGMLDVMLRYSYGELEKSIKKFESKYGFKLPKEVLEILQTDSPARAFDIRFFKRLENTIICGWSKGSWRELQSQLNFKKKDLVAEGDVHVILFWEKGVILLDGLWEGFYVILEISKDGTYMLSLLVPSGKTYRIDLTLPQYFDYFRQAKGLFPWQLMFIDGPVEGLELTYEFYEVLAILADGEPILQLPQYKRLDPKGSLAEMAVRFGYDDNVEKYLRPLGGEGFDYCKINIPRGSGMVYIARVEHDLGQRLPDELRTLFYLFFGMQIEWRDHRDGVAACRVLGLWDVFGGNPDAYEVNPEKPLNKDAAHYYNDPSATELLQGLYPFMIDERGDVVISIADGKVELYLLDSDVTSKKKLQVTLPEFITYLCKTRGIAGWHTYLVNPNAESLAELRAMVEEVFPETEW